MTEIGYKGYVYTTGHFGYRFYQILRIPQQIYVYLYHNQKLSVPISQYRQIPLLKMYLNMPRKRLKPANLENPFVQSLKIPCIYRVIPQHGSVTAVLIDTEDNTQVYTARALSLFKELPSASMILFMWICSKLPRNSDYLEINEEKYCKEMGISSRTFYTAKQGLLNRVIVVRESRANTYFVSPLYIYRGRRQDDYKDNVVTLNTNPLEKWLGKAPVSEDNVPIQVPGMEIPDMFDVASLGPDKT